MEQVHGYEVEYEDRTDQTKKKSSWNQFHWGSILGRKSALVMSLVCLFSF